MAPTLAPTPTPKSIHSFKTPSRATPKSKHRLYFNSGKTTHPSPNPNATPKQTSPAEHPIEVLGRIRDYPDQKEKPTSALQISSDGCTVQVQTEIGYRSFSLDGVSVSEKEDLDEFYEKFIKSRITGVKLGDKCTIMMYGPTGAGKSHTMFGYAKQPGIVYRALKDILGEDGDNLGFGSFVQVTVLEIYNEEIYDLLANGNGGGLGLGWPKRNAPKVRLEVMQKKAKNATFISGNEAEKISKEVAKVEKRRIIKSTLCNERSSRSHCMIILDVPTVGGRLVLVDMAGSENIEQAGQVGFEAKMQTAKINQGNIALKRVVESIANGDSHVPFRDSKLTMMLQDSFEDDNTKILMILCASPDPKEMHKTISTLEYGAKAKCIVRRDCTPNKEDGSSAVALSSRIAAMDQFINQLQMENKRREKEHNEAQKELMKKEEEVAALRNKLELMERTRTGVSEEDISLKIKEREQVLKLELEKKLRECQRMTDEFVEMGKKRMEEKILQQQEELKLLRRRLEELESELCRSRNKTGDDEQPILKEDNNIMVPSKAYLTTVVEEERHEKDHVEDEEVEKVVVEESAHISRRTNDAGSAFNIGKYSLVLPQNEQKTKSYSLESLEKSVGVGLMDKLDPASARKTRIQNIFLLCGNHRELAQQVRVQTPNKRKTEAADLDLSPAKSFSKENSPLRNSPGPEFGIIRKVLSDVEQNSAEPQLKRSRVFVESAQDLKENIRSY